MAEGTFEEIRKKFEITQDASFEFKRLYGLTFVFEKKTICIGDHSLSAEIKPMGIIYDEKGEYYFAPLKKTFNIDDIVKEYVENYS